MKYYFTSDYHLNHPKIIEYSKRPFRNIEEMNETIINNHNAIVTKNDIVFHIGDFCFGDKKETREFINKLNGTIIFIRGNHDHKTNVNAIIEYLVINHGGNNMFLVHDPKDYNPEYKINLCGHVHCLWKSKLTPKYKTMLVNCGVDVWDFKPISIEEIQNEIRQNLLKK